MKIWKKKSIDLEQINACRKNTMVETLDILITECGDDYLCATMPVNHNTHQIMGIMHGGASASLAETIGSIASNMAVTEDFYCVGLEINANHIKSVRDGLVYATAKPIHLGKSTHVWDIRITDKNKNMVCISRLTMAVLKNTH